jgi:hypothetical protein
MGDLTEALREVTDFYCDVAFGEPNKSTTWSRYRRDVSGPSNDGLRPFLSFAAPTVTEQPSMDFRP